MQHRLLLCDDEPHILRAAEFKFRRAGYDVVCAQDGEEAWQLMQKQRPDLVVSDCQMPRLDGLGLVARMRGDPALKDVPVFMLTAKGFELSSRELAEKLAIRAVLAKPFSPRELLRRVEAALAPSAPAESS